MFNPIKSILFATNLTPACRAALEAAVALAVQHKATLVLLHVLDKDVPMHMEEHLRNVLGEDKYQELAEEHQQTARQALIGKMSSDSLMRMALDRYISDASGPDRATGPINHEILVTEGVIVEEILAQSARNQCDLIVLGARKGFLKHNTMGAVVKNVMRSTRIPVLFVPPRAADKA